MIFNINEILYKLLNYNDMVNLYLSSKENKNNIVKYISNLFERKTIFQHLIK